MVQDESGNVAVWNDDRGSAMWKYEYHQENENVDEKNSTGTQKDRRIPRSRGQWRNCLKWRDAW